MTHHIDDQKTDSRLALSRYPAEAFQSQSSYQPALHNTNCGVHYESVCPLFFMKFKAVQDFMKTEHSRILSVLMNIYFYRANQIPKKHAFPQREIQNIFSCKLIDFEVDVRELLKRYILRTAKLNRCNINKQTAGNYNWENVPFEELHRFLEFLEQYAVVQDPRFEGDAQKRGAEIPTLRLYDIYQNKQRVWVVRLNNNEATKHAVAFLNLAGSAVYDWNQQFMDFWKLQAGQHHQENSYFRISYVFIINAKSQHTNSIFSINRSSKISWHSFKTYWTKPIPS